MIFQVTYKLKHRIYDLFDWIWRHITQPFEFLFLRLVQWRYKKITIKNRYNQSNRILAYLKLLVNIEEYYRSQYRPWGRFHPQFAHSHKQYAKHNKRMEWLFPKKNFEEMDIVLEEIPEYKTKLKNTIFINHQISVMATRGDHIGYQFPSNPLYRRKRGKNSNKKKHH